VLLPGGEGGKRRDSKAGGLHQQPDGAADAGVGWSSMFWRRQDVVVRVVVPTIQLRRRPYNIIS